MPKLYAIIIGWRYVFSKRKTHLVSFLSFLSIFGVVLAVALLIVVLSVMSGFDKEMRERILGLVPHVSLYFSQPDYDLEPVFKKIKAHSDVAQVSGFVRFQAMLIRGEKAESTLVTGQIDSGFSDQISLSKFVSPESWKEWLKGHSGIILGIRLAEKLDIDKGDVVNVLVVNNNSENQFLIASFILKALFYSGTELDQSLAVIDYNELLQQLPGLNLEQGVSVQLEDAFNAERVAWELQQNIDGFPYVGNWTNSYGNLYQAIQLSKNLVGILLLSIIAVAAFNVISSLMLIVDDKQSDIAILRTQGATPRDISNIFLAQGVIIGLYGCILGTLIGVTTAWFASDIIALLEGFLDARFLSSDVYPIDYLPVHIRIDNIIAVNLLTAIMCILAAIFPARKASLMDPATLLR